jgi:tRNA dimethylallyltransferase
VTALPNILVIVGPTASGKTALALKIAESIPAEIISADSRQIYRYLDIGTAKPTTSELQRIPHHFIDRIPPDQPFNAGDFQEQGRKTIEDIIRRNNLPIIVGGTGLYVRALVDGFFEQPEISGEVRKKLERRVIAEGKQSLFEELQRVDPESAAGMDATKFRRVIRALEVYHETGTPISQFHRQHTVQQIYNARFFGLQWDRPALYDRINQRVEKMMAEGFLDEVERVKNMGYDDHYQSLQTVGYKEAFAYGRREISKERMIELMKQNTRRFAKRQMTWFRKEHRIHWLPITDERQIDGCAAQIIAQGF